MPLLPPPISDDLADALQCLGWVPFTTKRRTIGAYDKDNPQRRAYGDEAKHLLEHGQPAPATAAEVAPVTVSSGDIEKAKAIVAQPEPTSQPAPTTPTPEHLHAAGQAIARLASKSHDFARLSQIRPALDAAGIAERAHQDAVLKSLWKAGVISGQGYEGHLGTPEEKQADIKASMPEPGNPGGMIGQFVLKPGWQQALAKLTGKQQLSTVTIPDLLPIPRTRQTAPSNGATATLARPLRLSTLAPGGRAMAKEDDDDLFDDIDDESEGEGGDEEGEGGATGEGGPPQKGESDSDYLKEAAADLAELGIHIPDSVTSPKDFIKHLCTAIKTHKATKDAMGQEAGAGAGATAQSGGAAEEESPMMMSTQRLNTLRQHADPAVRELAEAQIATQQRAQVSENNHKKKITAERLRRIDALERGMVIKPQRAQKMREAAQVVRLSLNRAGDGYARERIDELLDALEDTPAAAALSTRRGRPVPLPPAGESDAAEDSELVDLYSGKRKSIGKVNALVRD